MNQPDVENNILRAWEKPEHVRVRIEPRYSDSEYLIFSDLNAFIMQHASHEKLTMLDFGAGKSPYKLYFPNADYRRADILDTPDLHYRIGTDGHIQEREGVFDLIISTQVLEHVRNVQEYLAEAHRLLKKGGRLLLTTHGIWEEHGVPYDFQRWTEDGMKRDLASAGFNDAEIFKVTAGFRATLFIFIKGLFAATPPRPLAARFVFKAFRYTVSRIFPILHRACDKYWPEEKVTRVGRSHFNPTCYIILAAIATK
jgi:SAM-dependent methyltransferase